MIGDLAKRVNYNSDCEVTRKRKLKAKRNQKKGYQSSEDSG